MASKREPEDDGFLEIGFDDVSAPPAHPQLPTPPVPNSSEQAGTKRRWRLPLVVSAIVVVLGVGGYAFLSNQAAQPDPDAAAPTPFATQSQPAPRPEVSTGPIVTVTDREQLLYEPQVAWGRSGERFNLLESGRGYVSSTSMTTRNTSDVVVLTQRDENERIELLAVDARTGTVLWQSSLDEGMERCVLLADGHQIGCIAKGGTRSYVTVLSSRTGESFGTSAWQTDCIAEDLAGEAANLFVAGYTLSAKEPCLASGPVWDQEQHILISDGGAKNIDPAFSRVILQLDAGHLIAFFDDEQFIVDQALTRMVSAPTGSWFAIDQVMGPYELGIDENQQPENPSGDYFAQRTVVRLLDPVTYEATQSQEVPGLPWSRIGWASGEDAQPRVIGIANGVFDENGELLWELSPAPDDTGQHVYLTPDLVVRVLTSHEEPTFDGHSSDEMHSGEISSSTISAHELLTGTPLWTTTVDGSVSITDVFGDASIWIQFPGGGVSVRSLDLRTGDWGWTLPAEQEGALGEFDYFDLRVIGDVLIRAKSNTITAFTFAP